MELEKSPIPKYYRLKEMLAEQISSGVYSAGDKLPGVDDLATKFGVSRVTAHRALSLLQDEGVVTSSRGTGTIVNSIEQVVRPEPVEEQQQISSPSPDNSASKLWWKDVIGNKAIVYISSGMSSGQVSDDMAGTILRVVHGLESRLGGNSNNGRIVYLDSGSKCQLSWAEVSRLAGGKKEIGGFIVQRGGAVPGVNVEAQATRLAHESGLPVVTVDTLMTSDGIASVVSNDYYAIQLVLQHLVSLGHKRILCVGGGDFDWVRYRLEAFQVIMTSFGLQVGPENLAIFEKTDGWNTSSYQAVKPRLEQGEFSAVVGINDDIAQAAIQAAGELELSVPGKLSVTGIDNRSDLYFLNLTTVHIPWEEAGDIALGLIAEMILGVSHSSTICLRPRLVVRRSTAPCSE